MVSRFLNGQRRWQHLQISPPRFSWASILLMGWLLVAGCNRAVSEPGQPITTIQTMPIASVQKPASQTSNVAVKGKVGDRVPLLEGTVYQLLDETGKIWVLTKQAPPNMGTEVVVKGTVRYKPISINGKEQGSIYLEQE